VLHPVSLEETPADGVGVFDVGSGAVPEKVEFTSLGGHPLEGWFVPAPDPAQAPWPTVLLAYGYGGYKEQMASYARMLRRGGFATFTFDMEGSGRRRGRPVTMGAREKLDFMGAASYVRSRPDVDGARLGALGVSMGAATVLLAAVEDPTIKAIVSDSSYADLRDMIKPGLQAFVGHASLVIAPLIVRYAEAMIGTRAADIVPARAAARLGDRALFVIHGADDGLVAPYSAEQLYVAASGPKEKWVIPACQHADGPNVVEEEYGRRVNEFFGRWLVS
jgi:fermentation-respiration switch protein FrsA (DUF1100 family)